MDIVLEWLKALWPILLVLGAFLASTHSRFAAYEERIKVLEKAVGEIVNNLPARLREIRDEIKDELQEMREENKRDRGELRNTMQQMFTQQAETNQEVARAIGELSGKIH